MRNTAVFDPKSIGIGTAVPFSHSGTHSAPALSSSGRPAGTLVSPSPALGGFSLDFAFNHKSGLTPSAPQPAGLL